MKCSSIPSNTSFQASSAIVCSSYVGLTREGAGCRREAGTRGAAYGAALTDGLSEASGLAVADSSGTAEATPARRTLIGGKDERRAAARERARRFGLGTVISFLREESAPAFEVRTG
ncbi:hypothetical protein [Streptomyces sp. NPDC047014]|uniref:hypothetical protein n=1 Tax=Streptomyces sp. NPDC047014 TaxID=3155736 RepID=UPI0033C9C3C7